MKTAARAKRRTVAAPRRGADYELHRLVKELEWLRTLAHVAPVGIFRGNARGRCTYVNDRWSELTGYPAAAASGATWELAVHPKDLAHLRVEWHRCLVERVPFRVEHRFLHPTGRVVWALTQVVRDVDGGGRVTGYTGMSTDITELHQMREELEHSHAALETRIQGRTLELHRMERIVEITDDAIISSNLEGRVVTWNRGAERIFGYSAVEMIGQTTRVLTPDEKQSEALELKRRVRTGEDIHHLETVRRAKSGENLDVVLSIFGLRDDRGKVTGTYGLVRDISDRKRAERALRESEERLRVALDNARHGLWDWDIATGNEYLDERWYAIHGYAPAERPASYALWVDGLHPEDRPRVLAVLDQHLTYGTAFYDVDYRARTKNGEWIWINSRGRVHQRDASGKPVRMMGTICDITERKQVEQQLQQLSRQLLRIQDQERRRIARELHDSTAQTLAALSMNLTVLAREAAPVPEARRRELFQDSIGMLEQATVELRTTSYLLHPPLLEERGLPAALGWLATGFSERSGIEVKLVIAPEVERQSEEVETAFFRVVQESLHNVHRHSGSKTVHIQISRSDTELILAVRDRGSGPPPPARDLLGVGIAGMKERLQQLGGTLTIEPNHPGTAVIARLPLSP